MIANEMKPDPSLPLHGPTWQLLHAFSLSIQLWQGKFLR